MKQAGNDTMKGGLLGRVGTRLLGGESISELHNWMGTGLLSGVGAGLRQLLTNNFCRQKARLLNWQRAKFPSWDSIGLLGRQGAGLLSRQRARFSSVDSIGFLGRLGVLDSSAGRELDTPGRIAWADWGLDPSTR